MEYSEMFAKRIRQLCKQRGLSINKLADMAGLRQSSIQTVPKHRFQQVRMRKRKRLWRNIPEKTNATQFLNRRNKGSRAFISSISSLAPIILIARRKLYAVNLRSFSACAKSMPFV